MGSPGNPGKRPGSWGAPWPQSPPSPAPRVQGLCWGLAASTGGLCQSFVRTQESRVQMRNVGSGVSAPSDPGCGPGQAAPPGIISVHLSSPTAPV